MKKSKGINAKVFRYCRLRLGHNQENFAKKLTINQSLISMIERGSRIPTLPQKLRLARLMNRTYENIKAEYIYYCDLVHVYGSKQI